MAYDDASLSRQSRSKHSTRSPWLGATLAALTLACSPAATPCLGAASCPAAEACIAARCAPEGSAPVSASSRRSTLVADEVSQAEGDRVEVAGASVVLGAGSEPVLYLGFPPLWQGLEIEAAFLVLEAVPATLPGDDVPLEVFRLRRSWDAERRIRGLPSPLARPSVRGLGRATASLPVRIDVTPILRHLARESEPEQGLAVRAAKRVPPGLAIATGFGSGSPPRLDLYVRER